MRPPTTDDIDAIHRLANEILRAEGQPMVFAREEVVEFWDDPHGDPSVDQVVIDDPDGDGLIGWATVGHTPSGQRLERAFLDGGVRPDHEGQGIGRRLLEWSIDRATERLAATPAHLEASVLVDRADGDDGRRRLFERFGFHDARYFDELLRDLDDLPEPTSPDGIAILPWAAEHSADVRPVANAAFADHWGSTPQDEAAWTHGLSTHGTRLDLSFVAIDEGTREIVGYSLNSHYPDDIDITGRRDGWIDSIGTLRSHRGRGIASALIVRSLHAFAATGLDHTMLGVDSANPTGAYGIYTRLGYEPLRRDIVSRRITRPAVDQAPA
ncbi:MAG: GNAT family N-acetyltransferase [Actinomycetota bacterium]